MKKRKMMIKNVMRKYIFVEVPEESNSNQRRVEKLLMILPFLRSYQNL
jgi:hypothetical protein